ncbi:sensor histidine kinase [Patescibacteria group bacterium]
MKSKKQQWKQNNLLEVQQYESGKFGYTFAASSIEKIAEESLKNFIHIAKGKKIEASIKKSKEIIPTIEIDQLKIGIVFSILIENAINYTSENGKIEIVCKKKGENVEVSISDSGIGIPKDQYDKVFTRFFRSQNAIRKKTDGTGLGLNIAKKIINDHAGEIWFESKELKGTTFYFTFPIKNKNTIKKT